LLVLDNCEHLVAACAALAERLLRACPHLRILATSREALRIAGETSWRVPPLSFPHSPLPSSPAADFPPDLCQYEAIRLFVERARLHAPPFCLTDRNAPAVAQVCRQLDGMPLAIELAAARVAVLPVEQVAQRMEDRFRLLTGGSRTALPRHQTLRALIDWSRELRVGFVWAEDGRLVRVVAPEGRIVPTDQEERALRRQVEAQREKEARRAEREARREEQEARRADDKAQRRTAAEARNRELEAELARLCREMEQRRDP
jgi:hypothetical protein